MTEEHRPASLREQAHRMLTLDDPGAPGRVLRAGLIVLIVVSVGTALAKSLREMAAAHAFALDALLLLTTLGFALEYAMRLWVAPEEPGSGGAARARLRYVCSVPGLIDLVAAIPFAFSSRMGLAIDWLDIVPIFKLLRYSAAFQFLVEAVYSERRVLCSAALLMLALLIFQSALLYYFERDAQPDKYSSIPAAMWWGIMTLTTVGYGDITPVTAWGKLAGGVTAILGLCVFAIPIGIIASAFVEAVRRREFVVTWNLVAKVPLFRNLDAARIAAIAGVLRARQAERGERLIRKGDHADSMYFIVSGEVEVDQESGARVFRLAAGDFFGEVALLTERARTATITAATTCKLLVLQRRDFEGFMASHPELAAAVRAAAERRLGEIDAEAGALS
jgi:voltage-gated potassium channel